MSCSVAERGNGTRVSGVRIDIYVTLGVTLNLGIKEAKRLEFPRVGNVDLFRELDREDQRPWKEMLISNNRGRNGVGGSGNSMETLCYKLPEVETQ